MGQTLREGVHVVQRSRPALADNVMAVPVFYFERALP
jgi:hypothetical protein